MKTAHYHFSEREIKHMKWWRDEVTVSEKLMILSIGASVLINLVKVLPFLRSEKYSS